MCHKFLVYYVSRQHCRLERLFCNEKIAQGAKMDSSQEANMKANSLESQIKFTKECDAKTNSGNCTPLGNT